MNQLTVRQRKMVYAVVAGLLVVPIVFLGAPAGEETRSGGKISQLRHDYELGESSLGNVDPTSATMNLVLLGFRGVAASYLWQQAEHYKMTKNFAQLRDTVESIILLQPHFKTVWEFQAWNLAYNVSAECDAVADRYRWVKQGAKFLIRGTERNKKVPELQFGTGQFIGSKLGLADERDVYRKFFVSDPDTDLWNGGPDEELNPEGKDNYLVARDWYLKANDTLEEPGVEQHRMDLALFLAYPYRALIDHAKNFQKDGVASQLDDDTTVQGEQSQAQRDETYNSWAAECQQKWADAYDEWTNIYGMKRIESSGGGTIVLEIDDAADSVLEELAEKDDMTFEDKSRWRDRYRKTTSYPYWKRHCEIERRDEMTRARYYLAEGRRLYRNIQDFEGSRQYLEQGLALLESVFQQYDTEEGYNVMIIDEGDTVEEALKAMLIWRQVLELLGEPIPEDYPLKRLWEDPNFEYQREDLNQRFLQWQG
ncbi:hypothetical protein KOR42_06960 [Thalassoglobus neptunius]|uniref:IRE (Iron responsive element) n=1 Tax=Thalassoglobus neptunius TaxID=1938619 RepID=A0A5C5X301_9PLAN|nr:hypothetical protein [Thalassoglobus neptunius]TWT57336.1 hypothetical protein KOR42_06960 [Thalassoglobus neptunius]